MRVLHVCTEVFPILKTGGLADATAALPTALTRLGCDARILVPGFPSFQAGLIDQRQVFKFPAQFGAYATRLCMGVMPDSGMKVYFIDAPGLFDRPGNPYTDAANKDYYDNYRRFALLGWVAARLAEGVDPAWVPQVLHAHDWHAGLTPAYLKASEYRNKRQLAGSVFTVHNLAYQGNFPGRVFGELHLPPHFFGMEGVEFYQQLSFIKAGLTYAEKITTVSPTYAREILQPEQSCGLAGVLHQRAGDLHGILNGVDEAVWNPANDEAITATYDASSLTGKHECKRALQEELGFEVSEDIPLFCVVSRLVVQKGLDLVLDALPEMVRRGAQIVILGGGDASLESAYRNAAVANPQTVAIQVGYDERKSHRLIAGGDVILMPSRYEPCGLTQLYGLRYGTLPLVHRVGGLADTVVDCSAENMKKGIATGFSFDGFQYDTFVSTLHRCIDLFARKEAWLQLQQQAMRQHFSWDVAAKQYLALYEQVKH